MAFGTVSEGNREGLHFKDPAVFSISLMITPLLISLTNFSIP